MRLPTEEKVVKRWLSRLGPELFYDLMELDQADNRAKRPEMVADSRHWSELYYLMQKVLEEGTCLSLKDLAVNGRDALEAGLKGPAIGKALDALLEDVVEGRLENDRVLLLEKMKEYR